MNVLPNELTLVLSWSNSLHQGDARNQLSLGRLPPRSSSRNVHPTRGQW
jgi:hypothetical protein